MNVVARPTWTLGDAPLWARGGARGGAHGGEASCELDLAEPLPVNGGSLRHTRIALSMATALDKRLDFSRYEVVRGDAKIIVNGHVRYPDVVVFNNGADLGSDIAHDPVLVVEVLSRSTRRVDQYEKNVDYAATPSIQHYVMLSQQRRYAVVCSRTAQGWTAAELDHAETMELSSVGMSIPFDEIYRRISFGEEYF